MNINPLNKSNMLSRARNVLTFLISSLALWAEAATFPGTTWTTRTPAEVGLDVAKLNAIQSYRGGRGCIRETTVCWMPGAISPRVVPSPWQHETWIELQPAGVPAVPEIGLPFGKRRGSQVSVPSE